MVCYNHNPQGVSFESCATRFLCSDAPEQPAPSTRTHRRQSVGTGQGTGTGWTGATYGRWVDYTDGAAVDCDSKTDSNFDCYSIGGNEQSQVAFFIGFANWWPRRDYEPSEVESHVLNILTTHTHNGSIPTSEWDNRAREHLVGP